jgi:hypothetical protein
MPRGNRKGPDGEGPKTGRGLGHCTGSDAPGYAHRAPGMSGKGRSRGTGPGFGARGSMGRGQMRGGRGVGRTGQRFGDVAPAPFTQPTAEEEKSYLQGDLEYLKRELKATEDRIAEIEKESGE